MLPNGYAEVNWIRLEERSAARLCTTEALEALLDWDNNSMQESGRLSGSRSLYAVLIVLIFGILGATDKGRTVISILAAVNNPPLHGSRMALPTLSNSSPIQAET
jgi:hypothetical protein